MKTRSIVTNLVLFFALLLAAQQTRATIYFWTNGTPGNLNTNWDNSLNWTPNGVPGNLDSVIFTSSNAFSTPGLMTAGGGTNAIDLANFNNGVSASLTIGSLCYSNVGANYNNTYLGNGVILTVTNVGGFVSGSPSNDFGTTTALTTIAGTNGGLNVTNTNTIFLVSLGSAGGGSPVATLDLSALQSLQAAVSRFMVGVAYTSTTSQNRPGGILYLAATNTIIAEYQTASTETSDTVGTGAVVVGDTTSNNGGDCYLYLGQSNYISADTIVVGRQKVSNARIQFNSIYAGFNPVATFTGFTNSRVSTWSIGDGVVNTGTATANGGVDFSLGSVNALVATLYVGRAAATGTGGGATAGTLSIGTGTFNVNNAYVGYQPTANTAGKSGTGTINVGAEGGALVVNNNLYIANCATANEATGTLNVTNGGSVLASNIVAGAGNSTISLYGGQLVLTNTAGTSAAGLTTLNLSNATITVSAAGAVAPISATNIYADFSTTDTNVINVTALPTISSFPVVIALIQSPNSITLYNGSFNFALGSLPAGYEGQIILGGVNNNLIELQLNSGPETPDVWTGADIPNHNTNWSDNANWSSSAPGPNSLVSFNSAGAQSSVAASALTSPGSGAVVPANVNNIVNAAVTITSLSYTNTGGTYENTSIPAGDSLAISSGSIALGSPTLDFGASAVGNATISGLAGTLAAAGPSGSLYVSLGTATPGSTPQAMLDMSGLGTLVSSNDNLLVGVGGYPLGNYTVPQPSGVVYLAQTNLIYAASGQSDTSDAIPVALEVGDADTLAGLPSTLYLGRSNAIYADYISTARQLASGGVFFNPSVAGGGANAFIRGYSAGAVADWVIGDGAFNATTTLASFGTNDFTGGSINAIVNNMYVGNNSTGVGGYGQVAGTLDFNAGSINVNNLNISYNAAASDGNIYGSAVGAVTVGTNGLLIVNSNLNLAYVVGNVAYGTTAAGTLSISNGGTVWANTITAGTNNGVSVINIADGTLVVSNTAGASSAPLTSLNVTNAILDLAVTYAPSVIDATAINVGGVTNMVNILSLPPLAGYPVRIPVIQSLNPFVNFNFGLASLPAGYTGALSENNGTNVLLTIVSGPASLRPFVIWDGVDALNNVNSNWSDAQNWEYPGVPGPADNVIFNDTASVGGSPFNQVGGGPGGIVNPSYINNIVDQNFTISNLTFTNIGNNAFQNTYLNSGITLNASNFSAGGMSVDFGGTATEFVTIAGPNGTLNVNNPGTTLWVGLQSATEEGVTSGVGMATLDLSGLGNFSANVSTFAVGALNSTVNYPAGILYLAQTNTITASGGTVAETAQNESLSLLVGETGKGAETESFMYLGQMNTFNVNTIGIGIAKDTAVMQFNAGLTGTPSAVFRAADGVSPVSTWAIGDGLAQTGSSSAPAGAADFSLGSVNALVSTMYLGRTPNVSGGRASTGLLNIGAGTFAVATLYDGYQSASDTDNGAGAVSLCGPGGTLAVTGDLYLAATTGSSGAAATTGTLSIGGATSLVTANAIVADPAGNSAINLCGGTLIVTNVVGSAAAPLTSLTLSPSLSNNVSAVLQIQAASATNPAVTVNNLTIDGLTSTTNEIDLFAMPAITSYPVEIPLIQYSSFNGGSGTFNVGLGAFPASVTPYVGVLTNDTAISAIAVIVSSGPITQPLTWDGGAGSVWNFNQADWRPASGPDIIYSDTDILTFNDSLTSGHDTISIAATVRPGGMTFENSATNTYTFTGAGAIAGSAGLNVFSNGTVILDNSAGNTFTGLITITNGTLQIGANDTNGSITASVTNAAPGALAFNRTDNLTYAGVISGNGNLVQNNTNILTLAGSNTNLYGTVDVLQGTLRLGAAGALGNGSNATIVVSGGATLDFNSITGTNFVIVSGTGVGGNGALVNNGPAETDFSGVSYLTMSGNTTIGGLQRWDLRNDTTSGSGTQPTNFSYLSTGGQPYNLTKLGTNFIGIVSSSVDPALANIDVKAGTLDYEGTTDSLGNPTNVLTVETGATLEIYNATNGLNKVIVFKDGSTNYSGAGTNSLFGPVTLGANASGGPGTVTFNIGGTSLLLTNVIGGSGNLIVAGGLPLYLSAPNAYTGSTLVTTGAVFLVNTGSIAQSASVTISSNATINASTRTDLTFTAPSGQTLEGFGSVTGYLVANAGSIVAPGSPTATGVLTVSSNVTLAGAALFKINNIADGSNDALVSAGGSITYGGTLQINNTGANAFTAGQSFKLFNAVAYSGAFASIVPATPGTGLLWNTAGLTISGTLSVESATAPAPAKFTSITLSSTTLTLSGANGVPDGTYVVLVSTNLAQGWTPLATNTFSGSGAFSFTETYSSTNQARFYTIEQP